MHLSNHDQIPRFKAGLHVQILASDRLLIVQEHQRRIITDSAMAAVAQVVNGCRCIKEILEALAPGFPPDTVLMALQLLTDKGVICDLNEGAEYTQPALAFWETMGGNGVSALDNLGKRNVALESIAGLRVDKLAGILTASGINVADEVNAGLKIVLTDDYLRPELSDISARAAMSGVALLLVKLSGISPVIGPLIHPQYGSCLTCLQFWTRISHPVEHYLSRSMDNTPFHLPLALDNAGEYAVYGLVATCIASLLALQEDRIPLKDGLLRLDLKSLQSTRHQLVRRPQCPCCGNADWMREQANTVPRIQSVSDLLCNDGGYRQRDPQQTFGKYKHLISPVCGPISYLHTMPRRHAGMRKVYVAGYMVCPQETPRGNSFDKICAGKGQTDEQARASALCEALERFSGVYQGDESCVRASLAELKAQSGSGVAVIDFNSLQHFSAMQFEMRDVINQSTGDRRRQVPQRCTAEVQIDWTPAWSLITGKKHYVPLNYCYAEAPLSGGAEYGIHNPNGSAAGNCLEEAVLQGFLELVERDATAIWWYNRISLPGIDLSSFGDPYFERLLCEYASLGWECRVLDLSHDLCISVCAAVAHRAEGNRWAIGFGCHLSAHLAVQRALTEVNQLFDPDGPGPAPWNQDKLTDTAFLFPDTGQKPRHAGDMPSVGGIDLQADIAYCLALLKARDMDMLVINKTRPDIGLNVVQVIVPQLRHFWPRFGAGRLYSVPVAQGWLAQPTPEAALNPTPLFL